MNMKTFCLLILSAILYCCGSVQRALPPEPAFLQVDAGLLAVIDTDAYSGTLPPLGDVSVRLSTSDGHATNGELITPMRAGDRAPFNGVLFNGPAVARVEVEFRGQAAQCRIDRQADMDRLVAMARRDVGLLNVSLNSQRAAYTVMLSSRDAEMRRLYSYIQTNSNSVPSINPWPIVGFGLAGLVVGAGTTALILHH